MTMITIFLLGFIAGIIFMISLIYCLYIVQREINKEYELKKAMKSIPKTETVIQKEAEEFVNIFLDYSKVRNN